ncbi:MAG: hypothetical protein KGO05_15380, partial [Chloroflexota bacterium]|nr:hypothetical protein [Chloroflexota bacterium]
ATLGIVGMHFLTIYPLLYVLLFVIGMSGRLRQSLRVAASRACLAPGELELVTNDLYVGSAVAAVVGPLLGAVLFLALGDRIILVAVAAALLFLLAGNSDGMLDALPEAQRGFLQATPATVAPDNATRDELLAAARDEQDTSADDVDDDDAPLTPEQAELALPEWYQQGPQTPVQAAADIRVGLALAGGRRSSATALLALLALALAGGGLAALEVFYLVDHLNLPPLYLGVVVALEAGGLTLGALLASLPGFHALGPRLTLIGMALTGAALAVFGAAPNPIIAYAAALGMGVANALAITGAHAALRAGRDGAERRAMSASESFLTALASLFGALLFTLAYTAPSRLHVGSLTLAAEPVSLLFTIAGAGLTLGAVILSITPGLREKKPRPPKPAIHETYGRIPGAPGAAGDPSASMVGALWDDADDDAGDGYDDFDERGYTGEHDARYDQRDEWDEPPTRGGRGGRGGGRGGRGGRR